MATVDITVNGRSHTVQCDDGQESRLRRLAQYVDGRVRELAEAHGQLGDARLLVLASLLVADELSDAYDEIKRLRATLSDQAREGERQAAQAVERVAERIEQLAQALENA